LVIALLLLLVRRIRVRLRTTVEFPTHRTSSASNQTADGRTPPRIAVVGGGSDTRPQGRAYASTGKQIRIVILGSATGQQTRSQQQPHEELRRLRLSQNSFHSIHNPILPKWIACSL